MSTRHTVSAANPAYVTRADRYRISGTVILAPAHPRFAELQTHLLLPEHRRPEEGHGIALLESEEHSFTYVGTIRQIEEFRAAGPAAPLDTSPGHCYAGWPEGEAWEEILPRTTWTPGGQGIVTEFDHRGTRVVVYEYLEDRDGEQTRMAAYHCRHCHNDRRTDPDSTVENRGPQDRRWMGRKARDHILQAADACLPLDPGLVAAVAQAAKRHLGPAAVARSRESVCAATGPCAQIRRVRTPAASR
uniref:hypothetical protein n=1 Tax=Amycolatopsis sp. CA-096443 TaxID=3239919 RepID=UPI003F499F88